MIKNYVNNIHILAIANFKRNALLHKETRQKSNDKNTAFI